LRCFGNEIPVPAKSPEPERKILEVYSYFSVYKANNVEGIRALEMIM
jgi:hypothetical protein